VRWALGVAHVGRVEVMGGERLDDDVNVARISVLDAFSD